MIESYAPYILLGVVLLIVVVVWMFRHARTLDGNARSFRHQSTNAVHDYEEPDMQWRQVGYYQGRADSEVIRAGWLRKCARAIRALIILALVGSVLVGGYFAWLGRFPIW